MKRLLMGLGVVLGMLAADASAGCIGCGNQGARCDAVQCDQSYLWSGFSPSQPTYQPDCWNGGCGNGHCGLFGFLDRIKSHLHSGGCGTTCDSNYQGCGWDSMGSCCGGSGLGGYGGYSLASFHGLSYAGPRLMGNSGGCCSDPCGTTSGCCPGGSCFAGPCGYGGGGSGCCAGGRAGCHSFQCGWLSGLMERIRSHCCANAYSCGSLDPCGSLGGCDSFPGGGLDLNLGDSGCGCGDAGCAGGGCGGGAPAFEGGSHDAPSAAAPQNNTPQAVPQMSTPSASYRYPRTSAPNLLQSAQQNAQPGLFRSAPGRGLFRLGNPIGEPNHVSLQR